MAKKNTMTREDTRDMFLRALARIEDEAESPRGLEMCIRLMEILAEEACAGNGCDPPKDPPGPPLPPNGD